MKTFLRVISIVCLICWMGLIFFFSHQPAEKSSDVSGSVIEIVAEKIYPEFNDLKEEEKQEVVASLQGTVRTIAHYCIFGGLGFFAYLTFISYVNLKYKTRVFFMLLTSLFYAVFDEIHQSFIDGRSFQFVDIAVDFAGAVTAVLICSLFVFIVNPLHKKVRYNTFSSAKVPVSYKIKYEDFDYLPKKISEVYQEKIMVNDLNETPIVEEDVCENQNESSSLSEEFEYAAGIIGKTVVEATKVCNELTYDNNDNDKKELVNLVLGRTEVLKAEILKILNGEGDFEQKKDLMQKEQEAAFDYFDSIKAQI